MALVLPVKGILPVFGENCFFAPNATLAGDLITGDECSFWFNAVVRADVHSIRMGNQVNIQDGAIIHCTYRKSAVWIGNQVSIAHNAIVHGCTIEDKVLVGMGAIVMDGAILQTGSMVAAGAVVMQNTIVESGYIYAGTPARKLKPISPEQQLIFEQTALNYIMYAKWYEL